MLISAVELLKQSLNLYKNNFVTIIKFLALLTIPTAIDIAIGFTNVTIIIVVVSIITRIIYFWIIFSILRTINFICKKEKVGDIKTALKDTYKILWKGIGTSLLVGLFTFALLLLFLIPLFFTGGFSDPRILAAVMFGPLFISTINIYDPMSMLVLGMFVVFVLGMINAIFFGIKLSFAVYETVIADRPIKESIKFSMAITKDRWWTILWRFLLTAFVVSLVYALFAAPLSQIFGIGLLYNVFIQIVSLLLMPVAFAAATILYEELKKLGPAQTEQKT
ncbi:MAG: hypothetical protein HZC26_01120 [Candidatus Magasanikbacteria bacterium]|nr:hypothetical protein [Candidatus Magasanikbacteria bacterium]